MNKTALGLKGDAVGLGGQGGRTFASLLRPLRMGTVIATAGGRGLQMGRAPDGCPGCQEKRGLGTEDAGSRPARAGGRWSRAGHRELTTERPRQITGCSGDFQKWGEGRAGREGLRVGTNLGPPSGEWERGPGVLRGEVGKRQDLDRKGEGLPAAGPRLPTVVGAEMTHSGRFRGVRPG